MDPSTTIEIEEVALEEGDSSREERGTPNNAQEKPLVGSMRERLDTLNERPDTEMRPTIFRVPSNLRKNKEHLIEPSVVSIGPYHHGREHLALMEDKKWVLLRDVLSQTKINVTLEACVEKIESVQLQARSCYSEKVNMDDDRFVEMLILDGTFIIQFIFANKWLKAETGWASTCIPTDLILLENQIPFFVLEILWDLYNPHVQILDPKVLKVFRLNFCPDFEYWNSTEPKNLFHHLLHLCHHLTVPDMSKHKSVLPGCSCFKFCTAVDCHSLLSCLSSERENPDVHKIPCATKLEEAGIKCKKKKPSCNSLLQCLSSKHENPHVCNIPCATNLEETGIKCTKKSPWNSLFPWRLSSKHENPPAHKIPSATKPEETGIESIKKKSPFKMTDITFQGGKLEIPSIIINDRMKPLFINLLAFEQSDPIFLTGQRYLTSYAFFIDSLINTVHDVAMLQQHGILKNLLSSEEEVALFFNQLCDGALISKKHYLSDLFKEVNNYCDSKYHRNRAKLMRDYFNSPWSSVSFIAASILLGVTLAQTYFAGYAYFQPSK